MAHVDKYKAPAVGGLLNHDGRIGENKTNEEIDKERSHLNYNLATHGMKPLTYYHQRMSEVFHANRKDLNVLASWGVTAPKDLPPEEYDDFFRHIYDFSANRYGEKNVVSAFVHMDETTPHIHFKFIPVIADEAVEQGEKVCYNDLITRGEMRRYQVELQKYLEKQLGHEVKILNGATAGGNKTVQQLKAETLAEKNAEAEKQLLKVQDDINTALNDLNAYTGKLESLERLADKVSKPNVFGKVSVSEEDARAIQYYKERFGSLENGYAELERERNSLQHRIDELNRGFSEIVKAEKMLSAKEEELSKKMTELNALAEQLQRDRERLNGIVEDRVSKEIGVAEQIIHDNGLWDEYVVAMADFKKGMEKQKRVYERE